MPQSCDPQATGADRCNNIIVGGCHTYPTTCLPWSSILCSIQAESFRENCVKVVALLARPVNSIQAASIWVQMIPNHQRHGQIQCTRQACPLGRWSMLPLQQLYKGHGHGNFCSCVKGHPWSEYWRNQVSGARRVVYQPSSRTTRVEIRSTFTL